MWNKVHFYNSTEDGKKAPIVLITPQHLFELQSLKEPQLQPSGNIPATYTAPALPEDSTELFALHLHVPAGTLKASIALYEQYEKRMLHLFPKK